MIKKLYSIWRGIIVKPFRTRFFTKGRNDILRADGKYRTKIKPDRLPRWYVQVKQFDSEIYLSCRGIKGVVFRQDMDATDFLENDCLLISYDEDIVKDENTESGYTGFDWIAYGKDIVYILRGAKRYSGFCTDEIEDMIEEERLYLIDKYPDHPRIKKWKKYDWEYLWGE